MTLEHWDELRGKWVLYRSQAEASADCARYPYADIPRRIFLDTNVLNLLVRHASAIFEQAPLSQTVDEARAHDVEALMHIFQVGQRMGWSICGSEKSLHELGQTPDQDQRAALLAYGTQLVDLDSVDAAYADDLGRRLIDVPFTSALPDRADRELIGNAIGLGCDVFCTCDRRTIVRKRDQLGLLPIRILTPPEWWSQVKPWAGLWL